MREVVKHTKLQKIAARDNPVVCGGNVTTAYSRRKNRDHVRTGNRRKLLDDLLL
jgi:hypothetical protein